MGCDMHAVDIVHPDMGSSGGILETKKIGDYAEEHDISMKMHFAGTPVCFMANVHAAAATQNFLALELPVQCVDNPWWPKLINMVGAQELYTKGLPMCHQMHPDWAWNSTRMNLRSTFTPKTTVTSPQPRSGMKNEVMTGCGVKVYLPSGPDLIHGFAPAVCSPMVPVFARYFILKLQFCTYTLRVP